MTTVIRAILLLIIVGNWYLASSLYSRTQEDANDSASVPCRVTNLFSKGCRMSFRTRIITTKRIDKGAPYTRENVSVVWQRKENDPEDLVELASVLGSPATETVEANVVLQQKHLTTKLPSDPPSGFILPVEVKATQAKHLTKGVFLVFTKEGVVVGPKSVNDVQSMKVGFPFVKAEIAADEEITATVLIGVSEAALKTNPTLIKQLTVGVWQPIVVPPEEPTETE